jgi:hypothetical protein
MDVVLLVRMQLAPTWRINGATFSEGDPGTHEPVYNQPSVGLFGGGGYGSAFYAGGYVQDTDRSINEVHLVSNNGIVLQDTVEQGFVLFVTALPVEMPMKAELYDRAGHLINCRMFSNRHPSNLAQ